MRVLTGGSTLQQLLSLVPAEYDFLALSARYLVLNQADTDGISLIVRDD
jgi:hypothetical protein